MLEFEQTSSSAAKFALLDRKIEGIESVEILTAIFAINYLRISDVLMINALRVTLGKLNRYWHR